MTAKEIEENKYNGVLADMMLEVRGNPEKENMSFNIFLEGTGAGHETASTVAAYFMYDLALNPDHQQIVYEEIMREIGDKPITLSWAGTSRDSSTLGLAPKSRRELIHLFWEFLGRFRLQL